MIKKYVSVLIVMMLFFMGFSLVTAMEDTIGFLFKDKIKDRIPVKVYIKDVVNQSGQGQLAPETFRNILGQSLLKRRSIKFDVVNSPAESDIQVSAIIKSYKYMERGPLKPSLSIGVMFADAAATASQNYVEMETEYSVIDTKSGKMLWDNTISEYLKKKMTPEESIPMICDAVTRAFVWKCFGKANLREQ